MSTRQKILLVFIIGAVFIVKYCHSAEEGLVGYWNFDEREGEVAGDSSGQGNDGRIINAKWVEGKKGYALEFDGDAYVDCGSDNSLNCAQEITVEAWINLKVKFVGAPHKNCVASKIGGYIGWAFRTGDAKVNFLTGNGSSWIVHTGLTEFSLNTFHHVAVVVKPNEYIISYLNGSFDKKTDISGGILTSDRPLLIGYHYGIPDRTFNGIIDEVKIYNRALSAKEVREHYTNVVGKGILEKELGESENGGVLIDDNFEEEIGTVPKEWKVGERCQIVEGIGAKGSRCSLKLETIETEGKIKYTSARRMFPSQKIGKLKIDYYIRVEQRAINCGLFVTGGGKEAVAFAFWSDGMFKYNDAGAWKSTDISYQVSKWYHIRYDIDLLTKSYTLYIDNMEKPVCRGIKYRKEEVEILDTLWIESYEGGAAITYIDEIKVEKTKDSFPPLSLICHPYHLLGCNKVKAPPKIDGRLDEESWKMSPEINFYPVGEKITEKTKAYVLWDANNLYIGFLCFESEMKKIKADVKERDGQVWEDDCAEIFIDPKHNHWDYYHFIANAIGTQYDMKLEGSVKNKKSWDGKWEVKTMRGENYWSAEVSIPFEVLNISPQPGDIWGFNLNREEKAKGELSGWCAYFHQPEKFGHLVFVDESLLKKDRPEIITKILSSVAPLKERAEKMEKQLAQVSSSLKKIKNVSIESTFKHTKKGVEEWREEFSLPFEEISFLWWTRREEELNRLENTVDKLSLNTKEYLLLGEAFKKKGYAVCRKSPMDKVFKGYIGETTSEIQISLCKNEYEGSQLVVISAPDIQVQNISIEISDLVNINGDKIGKENIKWNVVDYVKTVPPYYKVDYVGWWPDILLEKENFEVRAGENQSLWITVYAPPEVSAGEYNGNITLKPKKFPSTEIRLKVKVWNFSLPKTVHLKNVFCFQENYMKGYYNSDISPEVRRRFYKFLLDHRLNPTSLWFGDIYPRKEDLEFCIENGLNLIPINIWGNSESSKGTYEKFLKERVSFLKEKRWFDMVFAFGFDEVLGDLKQIPQMKKMFALTKEIAPDIPRLCTVPIVPELESYVDIWCPLLHHYSHENALKRKAAGEEIWWYLTEAPGKPYPNLNIDSPGIDPRILPWMNWKYGVTGILYWSIFREWLTNYEEFKLLTDEEIKKGELDWVTGEAREAKKKWPEIPWLPYFRNLFSRVINWSNGAGNLVYPGPEQNPISSIRLKNLRDGIEDYEYLYILRANTEKLKTLNERKYGELIQEAESILGISPEVVRSLTEYTKKPDVLLSEREKIASLIEKTNEILQKEKRE